MRVGEPEDLADDAVSARAVHRSTASKAPTSVIGHAEAVMRSPVGGGFGPRWSTLFGPPISAKFAAPVSWELPIPLSRCDVACGRMRLVRCECSGRYYDREG